LKVQEMEAKREKRRAQAQQAKERKEAEVKEHGDDEGYIHRRMVNEYRVALAEQQQLEQEGGQETLIPTLLSRSRISVCVRKRPMNRKELAAQGGREAEQAGGGDVKRGEGQASGEKGRRPSSGNRPGRGHSAGRKRARPPEYDVVTMLGPQSMVVHEPKTTVDGSNALSNHQFDFDRVYGEGRSSTDIYTQMVQPVVRKCVPSAEACEAAAAGGGGKASRMGGRNSGGHVTVFAYGQTGSGKTYTMTPIYHSAIEDMLAMIQHANSGGGHRERREGRDRRRSRGEAGECHADGVGGAEGHGGDGFGEDDVVKDDGNDGGGGDGAGGAGGKLELYISFFEVYCSQVYELLPAQERSDGQRQLLRVLEDGGGGVNVVGLREVRCTDMDAAGCVGLIEEGSRRRSTSANATHDESSRSHAVVQLTLRHRPSQVAEDAGKRARRQRLSGPAGGEGGGSGEGAVCGRLSLVDLAGSERAQDMQTDDRKTRREGAEINKSLLALKECIRALDTSSAHQPFRGSKLTQLLKDSFTSTGAGAGESHSHTVLIATVSPGSASADHTLNTLRYAARLKSTV
jgi:kinesin family protein 2/24